MELDRHRLEAVDDLLAREAIRACLVRYTRGIDRHDAALCGLGVTLVFAHSAIRHLEAGNLKVLLPDWQPYAGATLETNKVFLWYPQRAYVPYNVRVLVDFLTARFRDHARFAFDLHKWAAS
jgi:DNA-binding transcriptional LysR family regulator